MSENPEHGKAPTSRSQSRLISHPSDTNKEKSYLFDEEYSRATRPSGGSGPHNSYRIIQPYRPPLCDALSHQRDSTYAAAIRHTTLWSFALNAIRLHCAFRHREQLQSLTHNVTPTGPTTDNVRNQVTPSGKLAVKGTAANTASTTSSAKQRTRFRLLLIDRIILCLHFRPPPGNHQTGCALIGLDLTRSLSPRKTTICRTLNSFLLKVPAIHGTMISRILAT